MGRYYTLAEARADGISEQEYTDEQVERAIEECEALFEKLTGRKFYRRTLTIKVDGTGSNLLYLQEYAPIVSITSLKINGDTIPSDFYGVYEDHIKLKTGMKSIYWGRTGYMKFPVGVQNVEIIGEFGYEETDEVFKLVKRAIREMVKMSLKGQLFASYKSEKIGDYAYDRGDKQVVISDEVDKIIRLLKIKIRMGVI